MPKASELVSLPRGDCPLISNVNVGLKSTEMFDHIMPESNSIKSFRNLCFYPQAHSR